jgi:hypothetical protein
VGQLELGGILNWAVTALSEDRPLRVVVQYNGNRAIVGVGSDDDPERGFSLETTSDNDAIVKGLGYAIWQRELVGDTPEFGAFEPLEFQTMMEVLNLASESLRQESSGRNDPKRWQALKDRLQPLVDKVSGWPELEQFAALVAWKVDPKDDAVRSHLVNAEKIYRGRSQDPTRKDRDAVARHLAELDQALASLGERPMVTAAALEPPPLSAWRLRQLVGVGTDDPQPVRGIRVAIFGGLPKPDLVKDLNLKIVGGPPADTGTEPHFGEYVANLARLVHQVDPHAGFLLTPVSTASHAGWANVVTSADVIASLAAFQKDKPEIILYAFSLEDSPIFAQVFKNLAEQGILVVAAASINSASTVDRLQWIGPIGAGRPALVSSVGETGEVSSFSSIRQGVLWAPGERIPVQRSGGQTVGAMGSSYAAAIAAGAFARIMGTFHAVAPDDLIAAVSQTALPIPGSTAGAPPVINAEKAIEWLRTHGAK